jgi:hypothetical protein
MATSIVAPVEAPAAAAPSTSAPAPAPTPSPNPAPVESTSVPTASPAAEPSLQDIVREAAESAEKELTKPAEGQPVAAPAAEPAKPAVEPAKPAAEPDKPATEPAKPAVEANPLDKLGPLPAEKITAALAEAPPEVQQYLKDKGLSVESLTENARLAAQTSQFQERFPTLEAADKALEGAQNFWKLDSQLPAVQSVEEFDKFMMETLVPMSFVRDEKGNPIPDPANPGAFKNDGSIAKLIDYSAAVRDQKIVELADMMLQQATTDEDKVFAADLKGAAEFLGNFIKGGYRKPGVAADTTKLPKEVQERLDRADRIERESKERDTRTTKAALDQKEDRIITNTEKVIQPLIKTFLDKTALSDTLKARITNMVYGELTDRMLKNSLYLRERDDLSPNALDYEQRRVALNKSYMQERVVKILESIVGDLGGPVVDANKDRLNKIDSQSTASRMEPRTSGTTAQSFPATGTSDQFHSKAMELARAENPAAKEGGPEYWKAVLKLDTP